MMQNYDAEAWCGGMVRSHGAEAWCGGMVHFSLEVFSHYSFYNNTINEIVMITRLNSVVTNWLAHISQLKIKVAMPGCLSATWPRNLARAKGLRG